MERNPLAVVAISVALTMAAAGCGGGDGKGDPTGTALATTTTQGVRPNFSASDLRPLLLQVADLPPGYQVEKESSRTGADDCAETPVSKRPEFAAELQSLGIQSCAINTLGKDGIIGNQTANNGAFSEATAFNNVSGASKALPVIRDAFAAKIRPTGTGASIERGEFPVAELGDATLPGVKITVKGAPGSRTLNFFLCVWRVRNVVVVFAVADILDNLNEQSILRIAKTLAARTPG